MKQRWYQFLCLLLLMAGASAQLAFGGNGKITGVVKDANGAATPGANVVVEGTALGAASDVAGAYFILNVPPGTYRVRASGVGFTPQVVRDVRVGSDQIVTVNFSLQAQSVGLAEIVVEADRPLVDRSQTSSRTRVSSEDFTNLPVRSVRDVLGTSASAYNGFIRGGKVYETKTLIDGVDVTDMYAAWRADIDAGATTPYVTYNGINRQDQASKSSVLDINVNSVEEASLSTGGVGADYSSATAGVISYSLREGRGAWTVRADARMSAGGLKHEGPNVYGDDSIYARVKNTLAASTDPNNQAKAQRFTYYPGKYSYGDKPEFKAEVSLGGSLSDNAGLQISTGYFSSRGRLPNEATKRLNASAKLNYNLSSDIRLSIFGSLEDRGKIFGWKNRNYMEDFRYFLEGVPKWDGATWIGNVKLTHLLSKSTFYELQASIVDDNRRQGFTDDDGDGIPEPGENGDFLTFADTAQVYKYSPRGSSSNTEFGKFFAVLPRNETGSEIGTPMSGYANWKIARPGIFYENFIARVWSFKGDMTSQISENHQLRGGVQARLHTYDRTLRAGYIAGVFSAYQNYVQELWTVKPKEYGAYLQDRMEYAGLVINLGFRLDALNLAASDYANWFAPFSDVTDPAGGPARVPVRGTVTYQYINGVRTAVVNPDENSSKVKWLFSPRIGVSHPISDRAAMYFSFSRQQQSQPFSRLYANYNDFGNPSLPVVTRTDQEPIRSTTYELGVQYAFLDNYSLDINAYYKDIQNYSGQGVVMSPRAPWRQYNLTFEWGYADARGIELTLRRNLTPVIEGLSVGGRVSYAYSYIKASVFAGGNQNSFSSVSGDSARYAGQLPWEDFRAWNTIERNVLGGASTIAGGYDRPHHVYYNLFLRFPYDILLTSVGTFTSGFYYPLTLGDPRARTLGEGPWTKRVDFRLEVPYRIEGIGRLAVYVDVINAFNWTNILSYRVDSALPQTQQAWELNGDPTGGPTVNRPVTQDGSMIYDVPREVYFGVNFTF